MDSCTFYVILSTYFFKIFICSITFEPVDKPPWFYTPNPITMTALAWDGSDEKNTGPSFCMLPPDNSSALSRENVTLIAKRFVIFVI